MENEEFLTEGPIGIINEIVFSGQMKLCWKSIHLLQ